MASALTAASVVAILGREVDELYLTLAKNSVLGVDEETLAKILGSTKEEVVQLMETQDYKDVRLVVGSHYAEASSQRDFSWDSIENIALQRLLPKVERESDPEMLVRIAAIANKAQRRNARESNVLDPARGGSHVPIQLSQRFVERISLDGTFSRSETRVATAIMGGAALNPKFEDIDSLLKVSQATQNIEGPTFLPIRRRDLDENEDEPF